MSRVNIKPDALEGVEPKSTFKKAKPVVKNHQLYESQAVAMEKLQSWYRSDDLFCTLEGFAGTGKTFITKYFINNVIDKSWTISAPTHKALRVIENVIEFKGKTLHSLLGLRPNTDLINFDIERPQFDPLNPPKIENFNIVIIDECSMINKDLFALIIKKAITGKIKILFIGDSYQLPPVNEIISPTFAKVKNKVVLTEIVRQEAGNPLLELFSIIREDIGNETSRFINHILANRSSIINGKGYELLYTNDFRERCLSEISSDVFKGNPKAGISTNIDHLRVLCYTNAAVTYWNTYIRDNFIKSKEAVCVNDLFMAYSTIMNEFQEPVILNSEDYIIHDIRDYMSDEGLKTFAVNLQSMYDERVTSPFLIVDPNHESFKRYAALLVKFHDNATKNRAWKQYYAFKNRFLTIQPFSISTETGVKNIKKDIDYGFGLSVHKSQGSTFDNVAIDLTDIVWYQKGNFQREYDPHTRNKLIYVALSRARNTAILKY